LTFSYTKADDTPVTYQEIPLGRSPEHGGLFKAIIGADNAGGNLDELDITEEISLRISCDLESLEDVFLIIH